VTSQCRILTAQRSTDITVENLKSQWSSVEQLLRIVTKKWSIVTTQISIVKPQ